MHFEDILNSTALIREFVADLGFEQYQRDIKTKSAIERQFQILTEAASRLGDEAEILCPGPDWKALRGFGNVLRHAYEQIEDHILWDAIHVKIPSLDAAVTRALAKLPPREE
jgi:uncharacterized protein with HEPN domain